MSKLCNMHTIVIREMIGSLKARTSGDLESSPVNIIALIIALIAISNSLRISRRSERGFYGNRTISAASVGAGMLLLSKSNIESGTRSPTSATST